MDKNWREQTEPLTLQGGIHMPYSWTVGRTGSRFLLELRDQGRILATRCESCGEVWVPPRKHCPLCLAEAGEGDWVEVGPEGTLLDFTVVRYHHEEHPLEAPFAYGLIRLDGATRCLTHLLYDTDFARLRSGLRVRPVMRLQPQGGILDIAYFQPSGDGTQ